MTRMEFVVDPADTGVRLDKYLSDRIDDLSRSAIAKLIEDGKVTIGEKPVQKNAKLTAGDVVSVNIEGSVVGGYLIKGERKDKSAFYTNAPLDDKLISTLLDKNVRVKVTPEDKPSMFTSLMFSLLPVLLLIGAWFYFMRMQSGGGGKGGAFSFGKSRAKLLDKDTNKVTFADVAGCDEAKEEVQEIVDYLKAPSR